MSESSLQLTPELVDLVTDAYDSGNFLIVAAVDAAGKPLLSVRGSVAVFGPSQLSFWARNAEGGTVEAIRHNPHVALIYRSPSVPVLQFIGRARVAEPGTETDRAYAIAHSREQAADAERNGAGVIIDLDEVRGVLVRDGARAFVKLIRE